MILEIKNLTKYYGDKIILNDINFKIMRPKILGLVAPNGSGKTTLFDMISNLEQPDSGSINILGNSNVSNSTFENLSYMQDNKILYPELTALDHLLYVSKCHRLEKSYLYEIIDRLQINNYLKKKVKTYSLGMKQALLLALAVISKPKILLLDEPVNGLDVTTCSIFREIIVELNKTGTTVIISSHNLEEIEKLTDEVIFLKKGKLISQNDLEIISRLKSQELEYEVILEITPKLLLSLEKNYSFMRISEYKISILLTEDDKSSFYERCIVYNCRVFNVQPKESFIYEVYKMLFE